MSYKQLCCYSSNGIRAANTRLLQYTAANPINVPYKREELHKPQMEWQWPPRVPKHQCWGGPPMFGMLYDTILNDYYSLRAWLEEFLLLHAGKPKLKFDAVSDCCDVWHLFICLCNYCTAVGYNYSIITYEPHGIGHAVWFIWLTSLCVFTTSCKPRYMEKSAEANLFIN